VTDDFPAFFIPAQSMRVAGRLDVATWAVDSNGIVPLAAILGEQYGAYTLRPKVRRLLAEHLRPVPEPSPKHDSLKLALDVPEFRITRATIEADIAGSDIDHAVRPSGLQGYREARQLERFVTGLHSYRDGPKSTGQETVAPEPVLALWPDLRSEIALATRNATHTPQEHQDAFLELILRRELVQPVASITASDAGAPAWAQTTLAAREGDPRPHLLAGGVRGRPHARRPVECHPGRIIDHRPHVRLLPDVLGQEDHRVESNAGRRADDDDRPAREVCPGRPECQHLQQHPLVFRQARPPVGRAPGIQVRYMSRAGMGERRPDP
jgi:hypothetical protein